MSHQSLGLSFFIAILTAVSASHARTNSGTVNSINSLKPTAQANVPVIAKKDQFNPERDLVLRKLIEKIELAKMGGSNGGGGDETALEFIKLFDSVQSEVSSIPELRSVIESNNLGSVFSIGAKVLVVDESLDLDFKVLIQKSVAVNFPSKKIILINRKRWSALSIPLKKAIVLHEVLSLAGLEESGVYSFSRKYFEKIAVNATDVKNNLQDDCDIQCTEEAAWISVFEGAVPLNASVFKGKKLIFYGTTTRQYSYMAVLLDITTPLIQGSIIEVRLVDLSDPSFWRYGTSATDQVEYSLMRDKAPLRLNQTKTDYQLISKVEAGTVVHTLRSSGEALVIKISLYNAHGDLVSTTYGIGNTVKVIRN